MPSLPVSTDVRLVALWVPRALPEVNAILNSFGTDVAQLRDMGLNRLVFSIHPPDLKVVLRTGPKGTVKQAFTYFPKPSRQKHIPF